MINRFKIFFIFFILFCFIITGIIFANKKTSLNDLEPVNIVYITDDNYVNYLRASIKSLIKNKNKNTKIEIYVIGVDLSEKSSTKILEESKDDAHINLIKISGNLLKDLKGDASLNPDVSRADNAKFFLTSILKDLDKVLYLDSDTIILKDLSKLYNTILFDNYVGAVEDWQTKWEDNSNKRYFNNGVMLLNLKKMREDDIETKLINFKKKDKVKRFVTQDTFNSIMLNRVFYLPLKYNAFAPEYDYNKKAYPTQSRRVFQKDVAIIHYCGYGNLKPWKKINFIRKSNRIWYKYAPLDFWKEHFKKKVNK